MLFEPGAIGDLKILVSLATLRRLALRLLTMIGEKQLDGFTRLIRKSEQSPRHSKKRVILPP